MRQLSRVDPFSLDAPDVRRVMFSDQVPVGDLVNDLEALGVRVPDADRWHELTAAAQQPPPPAAAPDLAFTAEQVAAYIEASAAAESTDLVPARHRAVKALAKAMLASIRDHADDIITGLRPEFDRAVQGIRVARDLGVAVDDDARTMLHASAEIRAAFDALPAVAAHLDRILSARQRISLWAGAEPNLDGMPKQIADGYRQGTYPSSIDWTVAITAPGSVTRFVQLSKRDPERPWARWFELVDYLGLPTVAELEPAELLIAYGHDVAGLQAAAVQRLSESA